MKGNYDKLIISRNLLFKPNATIKADSVDANGNHITTEISIVELIALNDLGGADLAKIDGITNGTALANKALVLGASKEIATITSATITTLTSTSVQATNLKANDGTASLTITDSTGVVTATKQVVFATAHSGLLHGAGASGANHALGATADNAMEYYLNATHTSGDMRGMYLRLYFSGAGGAGEAARIFGTVNNVATSGTVNGAHITLSTSGASSDLSAGAGNALRATFGIGASSNPAGTCAVIQVDTDFDNAGTVPTNFAFLRFTNSNTKVAANLLNIPNVSNGTIFAVHTTQVLTHSIKIISADGTPYYIMCTNAATNRS